VVPSPPLARGRHVVQVQPSSSGVKSRAKAALRMLCVPVDVMALPNRFESVRIEMIGIDITHRRSGWPDTVKHICS
jgi:hypothetical protein